MADLDLNAYRGIFAALLTPLNEDETLDAGACESLVHRLLDEGQRGLYLAGNTGEQFAVDDVVRQEVFRIGARAAEERGRGETMIAHVGGVPTKRALAMAKSAADAGCHAVAAIPPYGGRYSHEELTAYYRALAEGCPLPLLVYHIPALSGYDFEREKLSQWLEIPGVEGMKFTSFDLFRLERLATLHPDKAFFAGADPMLMHGIASGAVGAIGTTYNVLGSLAIRIFEYVRAGDTAAALENQRVLNEFIEALHNDGGLRCFKQVAARHFGWACAASPGPGLPAPADRIELLAKALDAALARESVAA